MKLVKPPPRVAVWLCESCGKQVVLPYPGTLPKDCECGGVIWHKVKVRTKEKQDDAGTS